MAVQAFAIVVGLVELDIFGPGGSAEILDVDVAQASELGANAAIKAIVGVTGVAGFLGWDAMILKMGSRNVGRVVHVQAFSVGLHDMAGKAKLRLLGAFDMCGSGHRAAKHRKNTESEEYQHLPRGGNGYRGTENYDRD